MPEAKVQQLDPTTGAFRYFRDEFWNAGQDSYANAPAQDPDSFEVLQNIRPITKGGLEQRWGNSLWTAASLSAPARRLYHFSTLAGVRRVVGTVGLIGSPVVQAWDEGGTLKNSGIFTPTANKEHPRMAVSRGIAYFTDGYVSDWYQWGGSDTAGSATPWGISGPATASTPTLVGSGTVTVVTNANPVQMTVTGIDLQTGTTITITGGTGNWAAVNGTWTATRVNANNFTIPVNSTTFGAMAGTIVVAGPVVLTQGRVYCWVYLVSATNMVSDIGPFFGIGATTGGVIKISSVIGASGDAAVDKKVLLATADGGDTTKLYQVAIINDGDTSNYYDTLPESTTDGSPSLLTNPVYFETLADGTEVGCVDNTPPFEICPTGIAPVAHKGRVFVIEGPNIFFSKNNDEVTTSDGIAYGVAEQCFPADFQLPISPAGDAGVGMLSDGDNLYIGTNRAIYRLVGDAPSNFSKPSILHNEVGIISPETWNIVFKENSPVGVMWLTPDFRVILSNFDQYRDVGKPVQNVLDSINRTSSSHLTSHSAFVAMGPYEFWILWIPTGAATNPDKALVYDLKNNRWHVWVTAVTGPVDNPAASLYFISSNGSPIWLHASTDQKLYVWNTATGADHDLSGNAASITYVITTPWLDFEAPEQRKVLNELSLLTNDVGALQITIYGANTKTQFSSPVTIASAVSATTNRLGDVKLYLAGKVTKYRFYKFKFQAIGNGIDYIAIDAVPNTLV